MASSWKLPWSAQREAPHTAPEPPSAEVEPKPAPLASAVRRSRSGTRLPCVRLPPPSKEEEQAATVIQSLARGAAVRRRRDKIKDVAQDVMDSKVVYMKYTIYSIHAIDAISQSFHVDFKLEMRLVDLTTVHKRSELHRVFLNEDNLASIPFITIANAIDAGPCEMAIISLDPHDPPGIVRWEQRFRGHIRLIQVLHNFPFDVQELDIHLRTEWHFRTLRGMAGSGCIQTTALAEWDLREPKPLWCYKNETNRACALISVQAARRSFFYVWNVFVINFILSSLGLTAYGIETNSFGDRSSVTLTLLLTLMAFKFTIADLIPKVSYFTFLDWYLFAGFIFLTVIVAQQFLVAGALTRGWYTFDEAEQFDFNFMVYVAMGWGAFHGLLLVLVIFYFARLHMVLEKGQELPPAEPLGNLFVFPAWPCRHSARQHWSKAGRKAINFVRNVSPAEARAAMEASKTGAPRKRNSIFGGPAGTGGSSFEKGDASRRGSALTQKRPSSGRFSFIKGMRSRRGSTNFGTAGSGDNAMRIIT